MLRDAPYYLLSLIPRLLVVAGLIAALAVALAQRGRIGAKAAALAATGLGLLVLVELIAGLLTVFGSRLLMHFAYSRMTTVIGVYSLMSEVLFAAGLGLVIAAIFVRRPGDQSASSPVPSSLI